MRWKVLEYILAKRMEVVSLVTKTKVDVTDWFSKWPSRGFRLDMTNSFKRTPLQFQFLFQRIEQTGKPRKGERMFIVIAS